VYSGIVSKPPRVCTPVEDLDGLQEIKELNMMKTRRTFLKSLIGCLAAVGLIVTPLFSLIRSTFAQAARVILPRGTKMESLVDKNPSQLDARNLDTTPLKDFGVMGISDLELDLNEWRLEINR
jgi:hypothetical protein